MLTIDIALILSLMLVGFWLESVNGKRGYVDGLLAPFPLGLAGLLFDIGRYVA